jgi:hypothetical protein
MTDNFITGAGQNTTFTTGNVSHIKTGVYTGDGNISYAITGLGFRPRFLRISQKMAIGVGVFERTDQENGTPCVLHALAGPLSQADNAIKTLDADGFTVSITGATNPNTNGTVYIYVAIG